MSDLTITFDGSATLGGVLDGAGSSGIRMLTAPAGLAVPVRGTVIYDAGDRIAQSPGGLLLLVGVDPSDPRARALPAEAAARGCTVVVIKRRGQDVAPFVGEAERHGVAVLAAEDDLPWRNVDAVLSCALTGAGTTAVLGAVPMGGELYALTDHLASVVGGAAVVEDLARRVIAYSGVPGVRIDAPRERGILQRRVENWPDLPEQPRQYQRVLASQTVVRFPAIGAELPRAAVAVRAGTLPLGTLWVIEPEGGISEEGIAVLSETARLAAPHLLRLLNLPEAERRLRRETLLALLDSGSAPEEACSLLGIRTGVPFRLLAFAPPGTAAAGREAFPVSAAALATVVEHAESELARHAAAHRPDVTVTATGGVVFVLLPYSAQDGDSRRFAEAALAAVRRAVSPGMRAALSRPCRDAAASPSLRREAEAIVRATVDAAVGAPVTTVAEVRHRILLDRIGDELRRDPWLRLSGIDELVAHDTEQGTRYGASITAWLDELGDIATAANRLRVHPNTLRHRLRRARELFALDLDDPDVRLAVWLELRRSAQPPPPGP
ncbi:helix-turn-helix domain-containing protein [Streptomyces sp. NBC_01565]|uniref:PucR family transcriptional regulator n=1 Tax=unclassified Streptomyces TaxID=2593676 RepID=UPI002257C473|nr:helix-turn-helix domain-containing protein [Streptomyces sp. NBC_01565]MCX4539325.1 helix-turn-helix domain-containing protein [Streptomyces sp. NBC_01565]